MTSKPATKRWLKRHIKDLRSYILMLEAELDQLMAENNALRKAH